MPFARQYLGLVDSVLPVELLVVPMLLASYMASGSPVLVSDVSDNGMYIKDGLNGFIIPPNDRPALQNKLQEIMNRRAELADIGKRGRETALEHFHYARYGKVLSDFLFDVDSIKGPQAS